jgi:hypothetical protein
MLDLAPRLSEAVRRRIDAIEAHGLGGWLARRCKEKLNALPVVGNQVYLWALRPDGVVLRIDHEAFSVPVEEVADPLTLYAVALHAARLFPELREMVPARPEGVEPCRSCGGTGTKPETGDGCLGCSGLGWRTPPPPRPRSAPGEGRKEPR